MFIRFQDFTLVLLTLKFSLHYRRCDSKNLNLSPFCDLSNTNTEVYWADQVEQAYFDPYLIGGTDPSQKPGKIPPYVKKLTSPMRNTYFNTKRKAQELLTGMVMVE